MAGCGLATVVLLGTLDTKGEEYAYLAQKVRAAGCEVILIDAGSLGPPLAEPTIGRDELARAAGADAAALAAAGDRGAAITAMARGAAIVVGRLYAEGRLHGDPRAWRLGRDDARHGGDARPADRRAEADGLDGRLGQYPPLRRRDRYHDDVLGGRYRGDQPLLGADPRQRRRRDRRDGAGLRRRRDRTGGRRKTADRRDDVRRDDRLRDRPRGIVLEERGYEVLVFHAVGTGGQALEALVAGGFLAGVLDATTTELADELVGGVLSAGPGRLTAASKAGLPQVVSLGALDMVNFGPRETVPPQFQDRTSLRPQRRR